MFVRRRGEKAPNVCICAEQLSVLHLSDVNLGEAEHTQLDFLCILQALLLYNMNLRLNQNRGQYSGNNRQLLRPGYRSGSTTPDLSKADSETPNCAVGVFFQGFYSV